MGTHLLASLDSKGKNGNSLACLRNAGSHSAETVHIAKANDRCSFVSSSVILAKYLSRRARFKVVGLVSSFLSAIDNPVIKDCFSVVDSVGGINVGVKCHTLRISIAIYLKKNYYKRTSAFPNCDSKRNTGNI